MADSIHHLYTHIPFCPQKCPYCAFVTHVGSLRLLPDYIAALVAESTTLAEKHPGGPLDTIYFGGGTPSLAPPDDIHRLVTHFDKLFGVNENAEITLEAHPDTVGVERLRDYRAAGVTRLSFGGESLDADELRGLGRVHDPARVIRAVEMAREAGVERINLDFMYGIPGQTLRSWQETLGHALDAAPDHLSLYPLSIEPRTVFAKLRGRNQLVIPEDEVVAEMYGLACRLLAAAGFEHYEVANWSRPGSRSRHNQAYWLDREFYAIGVGAHGYLKPYRTENIAHTRPYIQAVKQRGEAVHRRTPIDSNTELAETIMLRLRLLQDGLDLAEIQSQFQLDLLDCRRSQIEQLQVAGLVRMESGRLYLSEHAVPVANEICERLIPDFAMAPPSLEVPA